MSGSVHDVDDVFTPMHGGVLGLDGDALFLFKVHAVHRALGVGLVLTEVAAGAQQGVHKRGLAVVNVSDDGDVPDL